MKFHQTSSSQVITWHRSKKLHEKVGGSASLYDLMANRALMALALLQQQHNTQSNVGSKTKQVTRSELWVGQQADKEQGG